MCCKKDRELTAWVRSKFKGKKTVTFWKTLNNNGTSVSVNYKYRPGKYFATVTSKTYDLENPYGIHVFGSLCAAKIDARIDMGGCCVIGVLCKLEDFVHAGYNVVVGKRQSLNTKKKSCQCVFRQIEITEKAWKKAFLAKKK